MSQHQPDPEDADPEEEPDTDLADPDDYHRKQRLKEIHKARQRVGEVVHDNEGVTGKDQHTEQKLKLAEAVSLYIAELEPLIYDTEFDVELPDSMPWDTVHEFADKRGYRPDEESHAHYIHSMKIYRELNRFLSRVKPLVEEQENNEWEV